MRTLAVTQNITLDGVIDMAEGWAQISSRVADDAGEQTEALQQQAAASDAFLTGRVTFEQMRSSWPTFDDDETGNTTHLNQVAKYVVSSTMTDPQWRNSTVLRSVDDVVALKQAEGRDIVVTGSIRLTHTLIERDLVDEFRLFVWPAIVGHGARLFEGTATVPALSLVASRAFPTGVVLNVYRRA